MNKAISQAFEISGNLSLWSKLGSNNTTAGSLGEVLSQERPQEFRVRTREGTISQRQIKAFIKAKDPSSKHKEGGPEGPGRQREDGHKTPEEEFQHWAIKEFVIKKYSSAVTNYYVFITAKAEILNANGSSLGILTSVCPSLQCGAAQLQSFGESDVQSGSQDTDSACSPTTNLQSFSASQ